MRRRARSGLVVLGLDSFLDIMANSLGMLILLAALTGFTNREVRVNLGAPLMVDAPEGLEQVTFECRGGRVLPVEGDFLAGEQEKIRTAGNLLLAAQYIQTINDRRPSNGFHLFRLQPPTQVRPEGLPVPVLTSDLVLTPLDRPAGFTVDEVQAEDGPFRQRLHRLAPETHWIWFIARPDSFETLRIARKVAREERFQVGWEPWKSDQAIAFVHAAAAGKPGLRPQIDLAR